MEIQFTDQAVRQLKKIAKGDADSVKRILDKLKEYAKNPGGRFDIKLLKGKFGEMRRMRVGDYRVIFSIEKLTIVVNVIKHRQDVYHD